MKCDQDLHKKGDLSEPLREDLTRGIEVSQAVLSRINAAIAKEERVEAVEELKTLVEDWKGHRIEGFGDLLLHGQFTVLKGDGMSVKNEEREVGSKKFPTEQVLFGTITLRSHVLLHGTNANTHTVQDLSIRDDPAMLQGDEPKQAEESNDEQATD